MHLKASGWVPPTFNPSWRGLGGFAGEPEPWAEIKAEDPKGFVKAIARREAAGLGWDRTAA